MQANIDESTLTVFVPAWGSKNLGYLRDFALPSVLQPGNLPACGYSKIYVEGSGVGNTDELREILTKGFAGFPADVRCVEAANEYEAMLGGLKRVISLCLTRRSRMLLLMPDTVIAEGGIYHMREYARGNHVSVAAPHLRVNAPSFCASPLPKRTAKSLVGLAFNHAHQSSQASHTARDNGTYKGGIAMQSLDLGLQTIIHFLPTVYLAAFTQSDLEFFQGAKDFGWWDHHWPAHLAKEGRLRVFGSSELFFAVELTDPERNRVEVRPNSAFEEDSDQGPFWMRCFVGALHS